ncbi:MAG: M1 family peptidase, partial [Ferruginibacter sp.]
MKNLFYLLIFAFPFTPALAQDIRNNPGSNHGNRFEQLGSILPTPNEYRTASGAPGPKYWQQRCDYDITCELDEANHKLSGKETITYFNNSPNILSYLWLQLDENQHSEKNNSGYQNGGNLPKNVTENDFSDYRSRNNFGNNITKVSTVAGALLKYTINKT